MEHPHYLTVLLSFSTRAYRIYSNKRPGREHFSKNIKILLKINKIVTKVYIYLWFIDDLVEKNLRGALIREGRLLE